MSIFITQFLTIYLLGLQQKNVAGNHYLLAMITSLILGVTGWYLQSVIATANLDAVGESLWWWFLIAGPIGIVTAMKTHPCIVRKIYKIKRKESLKRCGDIEW